VSKFGELLEAKAEPNIEKELKKIIFVKKGGHDTSNKIGAASRRLKELGFSEKPTSHGVSGTDNVSMGTVYAHPDGWEVQSGSYIGSWKQDNMFWVKIIKRPS